MLEADIRQRAGRSRAAARSSCSRACTRTSSWNEGALLVDRAVEAEVELAGRGFQLVPAAFGWPRVGAMFDPPWQPALIYPPRGVGDLWAPASDAEALGELLGRRRARILAALAPRPPTTELARRLAASPAGVSEHLGVLRRAGLVRARREGRAVLYSRTAAGDVLTAPSSSPGSPS